MKKYTVAIIGLGGRGLHTYAKYQKLFPERMKITAVADIDPEKVAIARKEYNVPEEFCFNSAESLLEKGRLADVLIVATQDRQHCGHALKGLARGYDLLLEKPVSVTAEDCIAIRNAAQKTGKLVTVCHVLRFTAFYRKIKEIIDAGIIGEPVVVNAIENVSYWHQSHSFIRGNWRNDEIASPMILQKCCHDFDIIFWLLNKKCLSVSSFGSLKYFKEQNAPQGSADRCTDCRYVAECPYSAVKIYFENEEIGFDCGNRDWPLNILTENPTRESLLKSLKEGPYGRCVFRCDNNVVDHQIVNMQLEDGVTASLTMTGFTAYNSRRIKIMGTLGEIVGDQHSNLVTVTPFGKRETVYDIAKIAEDLSGHGGGDNRMMTEMFNALDRRGDVSSSIKGSIASHLAAFAAEESRLQGGKRIEISELENSNDINKTIGE